MTGTRSRGQVTSTRLVEPLDRLDHHPGPMQ